MAEHVWTFFGTSFFQRGEILQVFESSPKSFGEILVRSFTNVCIANCSISRML